MKRSNAARPQAEFGKSGRFTRLLNVSVASVQDWEQGRRSPRRAARTLLRVARNHPEALENLAA